MGVFVRGQTFLDHRAVNIQGTKPKYFIAMNDANDEDDFIICFVFNTEHRMGKYHAGCNKEAGKFIIGPGTLPYIDHFTSIMLRPERFYTLEEMYDDCIELLDVAPELLVRQIKNCIDWNYVTGKARNLILAGFK